jgi:UDP-N-acetylmuramyl pentapeptide phosphotransferase/UDP-N-acetylglucosamine-1-phosphate transferase
VRLGRLLAVGAGALAARYVLREVRTSPGAPALERTNFRGRTVTLAAGPALAVGAATAGALGAGSAPAGAAALLAGVGAGSVGLYDDVVGARPDQKAAKGFAGHLAALREGRVTAGLVKIAGVGAAGLGAAALLAADPRVAAHPRRQAAGALRRGVDVLLGAGVVAGTANLVNLLDLRPGRALKAGLLLGAPLAGGPFGGIAAGAAGAAAGIVREDLDERVMVGDSGANALGAVLGVSLAARTGPLGRAGVLAVLAALTAASEKVSFTQVIQRTPGLRHLDELGRLAD